MSTITTARHGTAALVARQGQGEAEGGAALPRRLGPARRQALVGQLNGRRVQIRVRGQNVFVNQSKVVTTDVRASNGIIHVVNRVLIP